MKKLILNCLMTPAAILMLSGCGTQNQDTPLDMSVRSGGIPPLVGIYSGSVCALPKNEIKLIRFTRKEIRNCKSLVRAGTRISVGIAAVAAGISGVGSIIITTIAADVILKEDNFQTFCSGIRKCVKK